VQLYYDKEIEFSLPYWESFYEFKPLLLSDFSADFQKLRSK